MRLKTLLYVALFLFLKILGAKSQSVLCPIGFELAHTKTEEEPICYRKKGRESFEDADKDCVGNLYTSKFYRSLNIPDSSDMLWSEYKTVYSDGHFTDRSNTKSLGQLLPPDSKVEYKEASITKNKDLCLLIDPDNNFTATSCSDLHFRYCFIKPYPDKITKRCFKDFWRFSSPRPACLMGLGINSAGVNWTQAQTLCKNESASLINKGFQYSNNPVLHIFGRPTKLNFPLGIVYKNITFMYETIEGNSKVSKRGTKIHIDSLKQSFEVVQSDMSFIEGSLLEDAHYGAIFETYWALVHSSFAFYDVICEKPIQLPNILMVLTVRATGQILLTVNKPIEEDNIICFTDSVTYYPTFIKIRVEANTTNSFILETGSSGYYWCQHIDTENYATAMSNKELFLKKSEEYEYLMLLKAREPYSLNNFSMEDFQKWAKKLKKYIANSTNSYLCEARLDPLFLQSECLKVRVKIKKLFADGTSALLHVALNKNISLKLLDDRAGLVFMRPAYFCPGFDSVPTTPIGKSVAGSNCVKYSCVGSYDDGVQWNKTLQPNFTTKIQPNDQVQQVIEDLDILLNDSSAPVYVEEMNNAIGQVDSILAISEPVHIPSELLLLLDQLGARVQLDERRQARAVRANVALLVAEPTLAAPVLGMRIAAGDQDSFTNKDFHLLTEEPMLKNLTSSNKTEIAILLPASVANSSRRISFVVFRNDRAFRTNSSYSINSRVLSINVENFTKFNPGEVVDIHLRPLATPAKREASRTCVYWQFAADGGGGGQWARDGCTLLRGADGSLDTCRCSHLTHFTEVLVPRTAFEQRHEDALELLSVVGLTFSLLGLFVMGLTAILFRPWRRNFVNKIWLQLSLSIYLLAMCFLVIVYSKYDEYNIGCKLTGVVMHYSILASFCWMLITAIISYRSLVIVYIQETSHELLKVSAFSWGAPCAVVGLLLLVDPNAYNFIENNPTRPFCYPTNLALWLTVETPILVILLTNWTLFILIVKSVFVSRRVQRYGDKNEAVRCASVSCLLVFLFGLPWIFSLFTFNLVATYFSTIMTTMQGFILFIFIILGNNQTRDLWLNLLKITQNPKSSVTRSI